MTIKSLKVLDVPWNLAATKKIIITAKSAGVAKGDLVKLQVKGKAILANVHEVEETDTNTVRMDKDLRESLGVKIGDIVEMKIEQVTNVTEGENVEVHILKGAATDKTSIKALLVNSLVYQGDKKYFPDENIELEIGRTQPEGIVKVTRATSIEVDVRVLKTILKPKEHGGFTTVAVRPTESFDQLGGLEGVKQIMNENIVYAIEKADVLGKFGCQPHKGIMLYGPPGTGKSALAKATANHAKASFIEVSSSQLMNKYVGETERNMREIFSQAKEMAPCIIFFDEIDAVGYSRDDMKVNFVNQLLTLMDEIKQLDVFVIGATNRIDIVDKALIRPGRFLPVEVPPPNEKAREQIFRIHLKNTPTADLDFAVLASVTEGFTGAQIWGACGNAKMRALRETNFSLQTKLEMKHIMAEIEKIRAQGQKPSHYIT